MNKSVIILALLVLLLSGCASRKSFTVDFSEPELTIYQIASYQTGCPERILRGLHFAESTYGQNLNHPNPMDRGHFGLNEKYHAERAKKWGEFNPDCPLQSAIIAGYIYMENLSILGREDLAVCAYRQGVTGVRVNGAGLWYYQRVIGV